MSNIPTKKSAYNDFYPKPRYLRMGMDPYVPYAGRTKIFARQKNPEIDKIWILGLLLFWARNCPEFICQPDMNKRRCVKISSGTGSVISPTWISGSVQFTASSNSCYPRLFNFLAWKPLYVPKSENLGTLLRLPYTYSSETFLAPKATYVPKLWIF